MTEHPDESHDTLDARVRDWYAAQEPSASLRAMAHSIKPVRAEALAARDSVPPRRWWRAGAFGAIAATVMLVAAVGGGVVQRNAGTRAIAAEIALNHEKHLEPDVRFDRYEQAAALLPKLGFAPGDPRHESTAGLRLAGGRYCSIHGAMAVQLRLYDEHGGAYTLYQFRPERGVTNRDAVVEAHGVRVRLWREGDLMFGLAEDAR